MPLWQTAAVATGRLARRPVLADFERSWARSRGTDMSDKPEWKRALQEPNAIAWVMLIILVIAIGVGTLYFGVGSPEVAQAPAPVDHAAR